jgi:tetratricopeptide (TPR) repeat protein
LYKVGSMDDSTKQNLALAREYYAKGDWENADPALRKVLEREDRFADVHNMLGVIAHSRGNYIAAEHHLEAALALNPAYTEAALNLSVTYNDRGKYDKARELYTRLQSVPRGSGGGQGIDPFARGRLANMHAELGEAYADSGLIEEAIEQYEQAVSLCPSFADLRTRLGSLLRDVHEYERAKTHYEAALASRPGFTPALIQLGITMMALGDAKAAESAWQEALTLDSSLAQAKMYLRVLQTK